MPQPRSTSAKSTSSARSGAKRTSSSTAKRASGTTKSASGTTKRASGTTKSASSASTSAKRSTASTASRARTQAKRTTDGAGDVRLEAVAQRVRKLNERIIEAGKDAGETTLTAYEKALKAIAASLDRGATTSDVEWVSQLLSTQAKFLRDVTDSWTKAARGMLK